MHGTWCAQCTAVTHHRLPCCTSYTCTPPPPYICDACRPWAWSPCTALHVLCPPLAQLHVVCVPCCTPCRRCVRTRRIHLPPAAVHAVHLPQRARARACRSHCPGYSETSVI